MKKKKPVVHKRKPTLRRTPQSEFMVKIVAIGLGMVVVLFAHNQFTPSKGEFLGVSTFMAQSTSPTTAPTRDTDVEPLPRIKIYTRDSKLVMKQLDADDNETELDSKRMKQVEDQLSTNHIIVTPISDHMLSIQRGNVATQTELPLIIDESDYSYTLETSTGRTMVTHLPNDVIQDLINSQVLDFVQTSENTDPSGSVRLVIKLKQDDSGSAIFEVRGKRRKKLFGFIPVYIEKTVTVSSQSGELLKEDLNFSNKLLNFFSI